MANCPKCNRKLRITDIDQCCPSCKVNLRFFNYEETFIREAKQAELSFAKLHVKVRRLKASFIGSKLTIARLAVMLLPLLMLLVPSATFVLKLPFFNEAQSKLTMSIIGLINAFSSGMIDYVFSMAGSPVSGATFTQLGQDIIVFAICAIFAVLCFLLSLLGFISIKNMQKVICAVSGCGIASTVVCEAVLIKTAANIGATVSAEIGFGAILVAVAFAAVFTVNLLLCIRGIPVEYEEGDMERVVIAEKIKSGEIDFDSLPQPIVETAATRLIEEEILKEQENFDRKHSGEAATTEG